MWIMTKPSSPNELARSILVFQIPQVRRHTPKSKISLKTINVFYQIAEVDFLLCVSLGGSTQISGASKVSKPFLNHL
jgi:hypothetical protein